MTKMEDGVTHVYIAEGRESVEALLHCFLRTRGFSHAACTLAELFASQKKMLVKAPSRIALSKDCGVSLHANTGLCNAPRKNCSSSSSSRCSTRAAAADTDDEGDPQSCEIYPAGGNNFCCEESGPK